MCYQSHQLFDWDSFELNGKFKLKTKAHISDHLSSRGRPEIYPTTEIQCGQIGRFNRLWATFRSLWQQLNCPNLPYSCAIFVKVSKSLIFLVKSFLGNFYRHLATFYWSHWSEPENVNILRKRMYLPTTVWRVPSLTGLNSTKQINMLLFICT